MTLSEAENLIEQIRRDEPTGRIIALWDGSAKAPTKYRVRVELVTKGRVIWLQRPDEWESVKMAWSIWLPELWQPEQNPEPTEPGPKRRTRVYYLVDGVPMCITQNQRRFWYGNGTVKGKKIKKYLGTEDPRPRLQIVQRRNERREEKVS
jgi:hypothetical protein